MAGKESGISGWIKEHGSTAEKYGGIIAGILGLISLNFVLLGAGAVAAWDGNRREHKNK